MKNECDFFVQTTELPKKLGVQLIFLKQLTKKFYPKKINKLIKNKFLIFLLVTSK